MILAGVSGVGLLIVIAAIVRWVLGVEDQLNLDVFKWLGNFLMVLTITYFYFLVVEWLTTTYAGHHHEVRVSNALLTGEYAWLFWGVVATMTIAVVTLILPYLPAPRGVRLPAYQPMYARAAGVAALAVAVLRRSIIAGTVLSGVLVNLAAIGKRVLVVVPSQTHGSLLPYPIGSYSPTWVEYSIISAPTARRGSSTASSWASSPWGLCSTSCL